jgi:heptosyltransferase-3
MSPRSLLQAANPVALFRTHVGPPRVVAKRVRHRVSAGLAFLRSYSMLRSKKRAIRGTAKPTLLAIGLIEHMGDIVAAEPILRQLRRDHPAAFIVWCVRAPFRELVESNPAVDQTLVVHCLTEWILLRRSGIFDRIVDLHLQGRICPTCEIPLKRMEGNQVIVQKNYFAFGGLLDVMCQYANLTVEADDPRLHISEAASKRVDALSLARAYVVIHCSSNERTRDWPAEQWRAFVSDPALVDLQFVEIGLTPVVSTTDSHNYRNLCGKLTLLEMAEVIRRATLFIGVESGPAHVANAVGTYGVILLGPYRDFKSYNPYSGAYKTGKNALMVYEPAGLAALPVGRVCATIAALLRDVSTVGS